MQNSSIAEIFRTRESRSILASLPLESPDCLLLTPDFFVQRPLGWWLSRLRLKMPAVDPSRDYYLKKTTAKLIGEKQRG